MSRNWPVAQTQADWMRQQEKRVLHQERRPSAASASDLLGPGFGPTAVELVDWNSDEAAFNGFFWSGPGAINSPDPNAYWLGTIISQDQLFGVQQIVERTGTRKYIRRFSGLGGSTVRSYTPWQSTSANVTGAWSAIATVGGAVPTGAWTPVSMDTVTHDDFAGGISSGALAGGFRVPIDGTYRVNAGATFSTDTAGNERAVAILLNTSVFVEGSKHTIPTAGLSAPLSLPTGSVVLDCVIGDVLRLQAYQNTGATLNMGSAAGYRSALYVQKIG